MMICHITKRNQETTEGTNDVLKLQENTDDVMKLQQSIDTDQLQAELILTNISFQDHQKEAATQQDQNNLKNYNLVRDQIRRNIKAPELQVMLT